MGWMNTACSLLLEEERWKGFQGRKPLEGAGRSDTLRSLQKEISLQGATVSMEEDYFLMHSAERYVAYHACIGWD